MLLAESSSRRRFLGTIGFGGLMTAWKTPRARIAAQAPAAGAVSTQQWWPSRWGPDDQAGASNWITPDKVLDAAKWIRDGKIYRLGRAVRGRHAAVRDEELRDGDPRQSDRRAVWHQ